MRKILILPVILLSLLAVVIFVKFMIPLPRRINQGSQVTQIKPQRALNEAKVIGWTAYWDEENTLKRLNEVMQDLTSFSPTLYRISPDGGLERISVVNRKEVLELARGHDLPIIPVVGDDFDFERVSTLLYDASLQEKFFKALVDEADREGFAGWNIDIESLEEDDRIAFTNFIAKAADTFEQNGLKLNVVVFARTGNDDNPAALAQDYNALGQVVDEVQIMMFGSHDEDTEPGGQAPLVWVKEVLEYTKNQVPKEKIVIGLSTHGYDWGGESVEPLTFPEIEKRIRETSATVSFDPKVISAIAQYQKDGQEHIIWFEDARAVAQKMEIIMNEFDIDKFALWRIGAEDPEVWERLRE